MAELKDDDAKPAITTPLERPVFILGCQKSGSSLLRSLLDGHPELFVIPSESHFFQLAGHWVDFRLRHRMPARKSPQQIRDACLDYLAHENKNDDPHGAVVVGNRYSLENFSQHWNQRQPTDGPSMLATYLTGYHQALHGSDVPPEMRVVEKSVEHAEFAPLLQRWHPNARFIHIVRNPYATLVASRNTNWSKHYPYIGIYLESMQNSYYHMFRNRELLTNYMEIRYEDLVADVSGAMSCIAKFLEITEDPILQRPTLLGEPWGGNSSSNQKFSTVSSAPSEKWKASIEDLEILHINRCLRPVFEEFGYECLSPRHHPLRQKYIPMRGERIASYLRNRALLWTY